MNTKHTRNKGSKRQAIRDRQRRQRLTSTLTWVGIGVAALALLGFAVWRASRPPVGEDVPVPSDYQTHIEEGTPPGPFPSDPPAGGRHYASELDARFYQETELASLAEYPEGSLVHNLEHGYVIFWYNCAVLDEAGCSQLKNGIQQVMDQFNGVKLIAFPWDSIDVPLVMTSWGKLLRFDQFNANSAEAFIKANLNHAPEPNAP